MDTKVKPFVIERVLEAPVATVWKAITDNDEMKKWYFKLEAFKPEIGFKFQFNGTGSNGDIYVHHCEITDVIPEKKLTYSWQYEGIVGISFVTFELIPIGDGTKLRLTHEGLETFPSNNPDFAKESFAKGWTQIIGTNLENYLLAK